MADIHLEKEETEYIEKQKKTAMTVVQQVRNK